MKDGGFTFSLLVAEQVNLSVERDVIKMFYVWPTGPGSECETGEAGRFC